MSNFFERKGLTQIEIGEKIGYSQVMVGRYLKSNAPNFQFITAVSKAFPDIDWNYMFKTDSSVNHLVRESNEADGDSPQILIKEIDVRLQKLKKWHESDTNN
ncbi:helix-turn-helix domain-containing protein [Algibacter miyuki]|uniref:Helix-turn-helix domain-containing protein n=1 Tax=Algibacter miyuki TaxID=1306933 RepID=A0ABV5H3R5_9FLAO|nr:helix-turn-helix transcriptional regulator [Algibacter miyuki]MDN3665587.1 helix-turn-helix transcriptional regulator [Algibacter miyuki]